jgi:hypothetical protein
VSGPTTEDFAVLRDVFEFHPLALEDSEHFGQRAKLEDYDDFVFSWSAAPSPTRTGWWRCTAPFRTVPDHGSPGRVTGFVEVRHRYQKHKGSIEGPALLL